MKHIWIFAVGVALLTACSDAEKPADPVSIANPADELADQLKEEYDAFYEKYKAAPKDEKQQLMAEMPKPADYIDRFVKLADENPDSPIAASAYAWLATQARGKPEIQETALNTLFEKHLDSPKLQDICFMMGFGKPSQKVEQRFNTLIEKSPHDSVKGAASFALAGYLKRLTTYKDMLDNPRLVEFFGEEGVEYLKSAKIDDAKVENLYESVCANYADVEIDYGNKKRKIGVMAKAALFEMHNLAIGCETPDIEGKDLDGVEFKLSDYRGKVVMLDFWGDW